MIATLDSADTVAPAALYDACGFSLVGRVRDLRGPAPDSNMVGG